MGDKYCAVLQLVKAKSCTVAGFLPLPVRLLSVATCNLFQGAQSNPGILDLSASCSVYSTITVITLLLASGKYPVGSGFCSRYYVRSGCQLPVLCQLHPNNLRLQLCASAPDLHKPPKQYQHRAPLQALLSK